MISNLLQPMDVKSKASAPQAADGSAESCARLFVNGMSAVQKERFKTMMESGAECGKSVAQAYKVPLNDFMTEVKKIL